MTPISRRGTQIPLLSTCYAIFVTTSSFRHTLHIISIMGELNYTVTMVRGRTAARAHATRIPQRIATRQQTKKYIDNFGLWNPVL